MSYYHIKNINIDKKNNCISADLADSCWQPLDWVHINDLFKEGSFEEKYANFIYNLVSGNFHPSSHNNYSKIVMNHYLNNYYDDAHDIGVLETYNKYKNVVNSLMNDDFSKCVELKSDRELNPDKYYVLEKTKVIDLKYDGDYYMNKKGELYSFNNGKFSLCSTMEKDYGCPLYTPLDIDKFKEYNDFLMTNDFEMEI